MPRKFTDNAATTLAQALLIAGTTLTVQAGKGDNFPAVVGHGAAGSAPDYFVITLEDAAGNREKIKVEQRAAASDALGSVGYPLVRGYDGTAARAWNAGDIVDLRVDKSEMIDADDKVQAGTLGRMFGIKGSTTAGLNFGYYGGVLLVDGVVTAIADGIAALVANQTNYIERDAAGVVSVNQVGFSANKVPLHQVVTDATGITTITDKRAANAAPLGYLSKATAGAAGTTVLTADEARPIILELTGLLTGDRVIELPALKREWIVFNNTTGAFKLTVRVTGQTGLIVPQGGRKIVYCDGVDIREAHTTFTNPDNLDQVLADAANIDWDMSKGGLATVTLGGARTMNAPTNLKKDTYVLEVLQDATGGRTIAWNAVFKWSGAAAPVLSAGANKRDVFTFICRDGATLWGAAMVDVR